MSQKSDKPTAPVAAAKVTEISKAKPRTEGDLLSQREAVFTQIIRVLKEDKVNFDEITSVKPHLTEDRLKRVYQGITQGFQAKKIALKDTPSNQKKITEANLLHTYIVGLVNNWVRRDPRLNGKPAKRS